MSRLTFLDSSLFGVPGVLPQPPLGDCSVLRATLLPNQAKQKKRRYSELHRYISPTDASPEKVELLQKIITLCEMLF